MQTQEFYRYQNAEGRTVIVDSLSAVPSADRPRAERVTLDSKPAIEVPRPAAFGESAEAPTRGVFDWPSFAVGFVTALLLLLLVFGVRKTSGPVGRILVFLLVAGLFGGVYLGWMRRETGQGDQLLASPSAVIQDARRAVDQFKARSEQQEREIEKILKEK